MYCPHKSVHNQAEQGKIIRFLSVLISIEKRDSAYIVTYMLAAPRTRHLLVIHEQPFSTFESLVSAFGIDDTEEIFEVLE